MAWLLDTNVLSELRRPNPNASVVAFVGGRPLHQLFVSSVTLAEIRFGIELVDDPIRRAELNAWLADRVRPMFEHRVLQITEDVMLKWRLLVEEGRKAGHTFSQPDLIIAATALHHGFTVVTRDRSDYDKARCSVVNPWMVAAEVARCSACGHVHAKPLRKLSDVTPDLLVQAGPKRRSEKAIFFWHLQKQAKRPITFGELCKAMRSLPKESIAPETGEDVAMVICVRARYALHQDQSLKRL
jgi:hypothetical protein